MVCMMGSRLTGHVGVLVLVSCSAHLAHAHVTARHDRMVLGRVEAHHAHRLLRIGVRRGCRWRHAQLSLHLLQPQRVTSRPQQVALHAQRECCAYSSSCNRSAADSAAAAAFTAAAAAASAATLARSACVALACSIMSLASATSAASGSLRSPCFAAASSTAPNAFSPLQQQAPPHVSAPCHPHIDAATAP
jgi:hypothetical protein